VFQETSTKPGDNRIRSVTVRSFCKYEAGEDGGGRLLNEKRLGDRKVLPRVAGSKELLMRPKRGQKGGNVNDPRLKGGRTSTLSTRRHHPPARI